MSTRPAPCLVLICPPLTGGAECTLREAGQRQQWRRVRLDAPQLDYYNLAPLGAGWEVWTHAGRYLSDHTMAFLSWAALSAPEPHA